MDSGSLLFANPRTRLGRVRGGRLRLPQDGRGSAGTYSVQREQHTATIVRTAIVILVQLLPNAAIGAVGTAFVPHGEAIVEQARVRRSFPRGNVVQLLRVERGVLRASAGIVDEAGGDDAGVVPALEGVGLLAGAGVAVEVFLEGRERECDVLNIGVVMSRKMPSPPLLLFAPLFYPDNENIHKDNTGMAPAPQGSL